MDERISLDYGSGGRKTAELINELILPAIGNRYLDGLGDGAVLPGTEKLVFSTDSFVISPLFFPGGDIGRLAVCGTLNDVSMAGGEPKYLSLSLVIEEGFPSADLRRILQSAAAELEKAGVLLVTGDTKVVEKGGCDGLFINTAGIGFLKAPGLSPKKIRPGDRILVSGPVGDHGLTVLLARHPHLLNSELKSDCRNLMPLAAALYTLGGDLRMLRDPTRGGLATALAEIAKESACGMELTERDIPVSRQTQAACRLLGLDPLYIGNDGMMIAVVPAEQADKALEAMKSAEHGKDAAIIGHVQAGEGAYIKTHLGATRRFDVLYGEGLPRIC